MDRLEQFFRRGQSAQAAVDAVIGEHMAQIQTLAGNQEAIDIVERTRIEIVARNGDVFVHYYEPLITAKPIKEVEAS